MSDQVSRPTGDFSLPATFRRFTAFLRRPDIPDAATGMNAITLRRTCMLYLLDLSLMVPLILIAFAAETLGLTFPDNALEDLDLGPLEIMFVVLLVPALEEAVFRGWLSGRPAHLVPFLLVAAGYAALAGGLFLPHLGGAGLIFAVLIIATVLSAMKQGQPPYAWFRTTFPVFFAISSLSFALVHLFNYEGASLAYALPLVIPQFIAGLIFGYARVTYGLWSAILLHVLHNGTAIGIILAFGG